MQESNDPMTTAEPVAPTRDPWDLALERLRNRHPKATEGTLFCVHKLELDPDTSLRDFQAEVSEAQTAALEA